MLGRVFLLIAVGLVIVPAASGDPSAPYPRCTINGTGSGDTIAGSGANNVICGHQGSDLIVGGGGRDWLRGGRGSDTLHARDGEGGDVLVGAKGFDTCLADRGDIVDSSCERYFVGSDRFRP